MSASLRHFSAEDELRMAHAAAYGAALAAGDGKKPAIRRYARTLLKLAYPDYRGTR